MKQQPRKGPGVVAGARRVRCAIYTRKSTEEGLEQEFNSLDAQREAAEAFVASQKSDGWVCLPDRYDDGGFTGGNVDRPALQRLLADVSSGAIDCVVVYKVDRLSRSLLDFTKIMETFERHGVAFVSVTQQFNTSHSMGRLTLNVLLSFAQFEREIIGERIRDKIAAQRRRGKWAGGKPVLGYDVERPVHGGSPRLVVNPTEAARVRAIFELYEANGSLLPVVKELHSRGWTNKAWTARSGRSMGGRPFDRPTLHALLTNPIYAGQIIHKGERFPGEHEAIVTADRFESVQRTLKSNRNGRGAASQERSDVLLRGLLRCRSCNCAMVHVVAGSGPKRYRYYVCSKANRTSRATCPGSSLPAAEIEKAVVDQLRGVVRDRALIAETVKTAHELVDAEVERLGSELVAAGAAKRQRESERARLAGKTERSEDENARPSAIGRAVAEYAERAARLTVEIATLRESKVSRDEVAAALAEFDGTWSSLSPSEQRNVVHGLLERVEYDAAESAVELFFHGSALKSLASGSLEVAA